jgi:hypothetical protein
MNYRHNLSAAEARAPREYLDIPATVHGFCRHEALHELGEIENGKVKVQPHGSACSVDHDPSRTRAKRCDWKLIFSGTMIFLGQEEVPARAFIYIEKVQMYLPNQGWHDPPSYKLMLVLVPPPSRDGPSRGGPHPLLW